MCVLQFCNRTPGAIVDKNTDFRPNSLGCLVSVQIEGHPSNIKWVECTLYLITGFINNNDKILHT